MSQNSRILLIPLRSLGDEVFLSGDEEGSAGVYEVTGDYSGGEGYPWLREHLVTGYA